MRSIQRKFDEISKKRPKNGSFDCFVNAIKGRGYKKRIILKWFNTLVSREDYAKGEKKELLEYLYNVSNVPKELPKYLYRVSNTPVECIK
jgi:hypothetical protein